MRGVDPVLVEVAQGAVEAVETLLSLPGLDRAVIRDVPEFDVGIERAGRLPPSPARCDNRIRR